MNKHKMTNMEVTNLIRISVNKETGVIPLIIRLPYGWEEPNVWLSASSKTLFSSKESADYSEDMSTGGRERLRAEAEQKRIDRAKVIAPNDYTEEFVFSHDEYVSFDDWLDDEESEWAWGCVLETDTTNVVDDFSEWWSSRCQDDGDMFDWPVVVWDALEAAQKLIEQHRPETWLVDYTRRVLKS